MVTFAMSYNAKVSLLHISGLQHVVWLNQLMLSAHFRQWFIYTYQMLSNLY